MNPIIKVGYCVAYDWLILLKSFPKIYANADIICFSIDKDHLSWTGLPFVFEKAKFYGWVKEVDVDKKIKIYEDSFYLPQLSAIENENRQRAMMSEYLGLGGWHIQIDADEHFFDFGGFCNYLLHLIPLPLGNEKPINVYTNGIPLIKKTTQGYLFVQNQTNNHEEIPIATNKPEYHSARRNSHFNHLSPFFVLHETWARSETEMQVKLNSWGHVNDFISKESYYKLWLALDEYNYRYISNFHPLKPQIWEKLNFAPAQNIDELMNFFRLSNTLKISRQYLRKRNSRVLQGIKRRLKIKK